MSVPPNFGLFGIAPEIATALAGKRAVLCGFDKAETARIGAVLRRANAISNRFEENWLLDSGQVGDLLLIKLGGVGPAAMQAAAGAAVPVMLVGRGELLLEVAAGAYAWGRELLSEPWTDAELLLRAYHLMAGPGRTPARAAEPQRPLVLIADDDPAWIALVEATLRSHGVACKSATDGIRALQSARELVPDLLVLDLHMPGMGGFEVLEKMRQDPRFENLPVLLLTASCEEEDVTRGSTLGAHEYLLKPLSPALLLKRIERHLSSRDAGLDGSNPAETLREAPARGPMQPAGKGT